MIVAVALLTALTTYLKDRWDLLWYFLSLMVLILDVFMIRGEGLLGLAGFAISMTALIPALGVTVGLLLDGNLQNLGGWRNSYDKL